VVFVALKRPPRRTNRVACEGTFTPHPAPAPVSLPGTLRRATPDDAPAVARLLQVAYKDNEKLGVEYNAAAVTEERVRRYLVRDEVWVLERDGRLVATVGLQRHIEVRRLAVDPDARGSGVAAELLAFAEGEAAQAGFREAQLFVDGDHPWLQGFYTRHGWEEEGRVSVPEYPGWEMVKFQKRLGR